MECLILKAMFPDPGKEIEGIIVKEKDREQSKYRFIWTKKHEDMEALLDQLKKLNEDCNMQEEFEEFHGTAGELIRKMQILNRPG